MSHRRSPAAFAFAFAVALLLALPSCVNGVASGGCNSNSDCAGGICIDGTCIEVDQVDLSCQVDSDCDAAADQRCVAGACQAPSEAAGCTVTADCTTDQYCNSATGACQPLLAGWCRESSQCTGTATVCSSQSPAVPGRCVECVVNEDCRGGAVCVQPGLCEQSGGTPGGGRPGGGTPGDDTPGGGTPGGGTPGGGTPGGGMPGDDTPGDDTPGDDTPGDDTPGDDTPGGSTPGDDTGGGTPGEDTGSSGGGDTGGGSGDVCQDRGWYGDGECDTFCPQPDPDCSGGNPGGGGGTGECFDMADCWSAGYSFNFTCANESCVCDVAWLESFVCDFGETVDLFACACVPAGSGGGGDVCADFGYYGDGECDTFCAQPDPDCSGGNPGGGIGEHQSCVSGGQLLTCAAGLECIWAPDANDNPSFGACKRVCASDADCGQDGCVEGFLAGGNGVCGTALTAGQSGCGFWDQGATFCFDPTAPSGLTDASLECLSGTCGYVCDYAGNPDAPWVCPGGGVCGTSYDSYPGYGVELAVCQ